MQPSQLSRFSSLTWSSCAELSCWAEGSKRRHSTIVSAGGGCSSGTHQRKKQIPHKNKTTSQQKYNLKKKKKPLGSETLEGYLKYCFGFFDSVVSHKGGKSWVIAFWSLEKCEGKQLAVDRPGLGWKNGNSSSSGLALFLVFLVVVKDVCCLRKMIH